MLYHLIKWMHMHAILPGEAYIDAFSLRAAMALGFSMLVGIAMGKPCIAFLHALAAQEHVRDLGLQGEKGKQGTPGMGGIMLLLGILLTTLLFARLDSVYTLLLMFSTLAMGLVGLWDDYVKIYRKHKQGIAPRVKLLGQLATGLAVGLVLVYHPDVVVRTWTISEGLLEGGQDVSSLVTTLPLVKENTWDYSYWVGLCMQPTYTWIVYVLVAAWIVMAVSNSVNLMDGIDGLAAGTVGIVAATLAFLAYASGHMVWARYLHIMYIPGAEEIVVFCAALVGSCIGFIWYNAYPAQVFMGDTGSLALGTSLAVVALSLRKELLLPFMGGTMLLETLSVIVQVGYFRYTRWRYGTGVRLLAMAPLHHHFQMGGMHEVKIVVRMLIVAAVLGILTVLIL